MKTLLMILMLLTPVAAQASRAHDLYQQALVAERGAGDLKRAITLYEQALAAAGSDRQLAARALVQIGRAYEILGNAEAKKAYQRVLDEFGEQRTEAAAARSRLASLERTGPEKERSGQHAARLVWKPLLDSEGEVSANGRILSFVDWETGDMAIRDLEKRVSRRLTDKGPWEKSDAFGGQSRVSADGRWVAYTWYDEDSVVDLRLAATDGSTSRAILREDSIAYVEPGGFSRDGRMLIAAIARKDGNNELGILDLTNGKLNILAPFGDRHPHPTGFSPDGRWILYSMPPEKTSPQRDVFVMPSAGGTARAIAGNSANDLAVGWSPDGKGILFLSNRSGERALWLAPFSEQGGGADPQLLEPRLGDGTPLGVTDDGSFYYSIVRNNRQAYLVDLNADGMPAGKPRRVGDAVGIDTYPTFSGDGKAMAYLSRRGAGNPTRPNEQVLVIRDLGSGKETSRPFRVIPHPAQGLSWSPDGKRLAVKGRDFTFSAGTYQWLFVADMQTGSIEAIPDSKESGGRHPLWSPDGESLYYIGSGKIRRRAIPSGEERVVYSPAPGESINALALSPDGKSLVLRPLGPTYTEVDVLRIIPTEGGEPRDILREPISTKGANITGGTGLVWTPDGKHIIFGRWDRYSLGDKIDVGVSLFRVPATGGVSEPLRISMPQIKALRIHPNGRMLAFTAGGEPEELWVLENFLGPEEGK